MNGGLYSTPPASPNAMTISVNGQTIPTPKADRGFVVLHREWRAGDEVLVTMAMPVQRVRADERVESDRRRVALARGPIIYCLESQDAGGSVRDVFLPDDAPIEIERQSGILGGATVLRAAARRLPVENGEPVRAEITAIPYYANSNRGSAEMIVWLPTTSADVRRPTIASLATPTASHCFQNDTVHAMNDVVVPPRNSSDETRAGGSPGGTAEVPLNGRNTISTDRTSSVVPASIGGTIIASAVTARHP